MAEQRMSKKLIVYAIIVCIAVFALYAFEFFVDKYEESKTAALGNKVVKTIDYETSSKADFHTFEDKIYYCTKDGVQLLNSKGEVLWADTYNMSKPYMVYDGNIVAITEPTGKNVVVCNENGRMYMVSTKDEVLSVAVNTSGYSSVINAKGEDSYELNVYNSEGKSIFYGQFQSADGIPIVSDISDDNEILAVSFLCYNDVAMQTKVLFYYIKSGKGIKNEESDSDGMFASCIKENQIAAMVSFMKDNNAVIVTDSEVICVDLSKSYAEKWSIPIENKLDCVCFSSKSYVVLGYGEAVINAKQPVKEGTVKWYDLSGKPVCEYSGDKKITAMYPYDDEVVIAMGKNYKSMNKNGSMVWEYDAVQDVDKILSLDNSNTILFVTQNKTDIISLNQKYSNEAELENAETKKAEAEKTALEKENDGENIKEENKEPETEALTEKNTEKKAVEADKEDEVASGGAVKNN